jgi:hypothetical protein
LGDFPQIVVCVKIDLNLRVTVYQCGYQVPASDLDWLFRKSSKVTRFSQFENLLNRYAADLSSDKLFKFFLQETMLKCISQIMEFYEEEDETSVKLKFLKEQFELACCEKKTTRRYSPKMLISAFIIHMQSPASYDAL